MDPINVGLFFLGVALLVAVVAGLARIWQAFRPSPPLHQQFVRRQEYDEFKEQMLKDVGRLSGKVDSTANMVMSKIDDLRRDLQVAEERRIKDLHEKVNRIALQTTANETRIESMQKKQQRP